MVKMPTVERRVLQRKRKNKDEEEQETHEIIVKKKQKKAKTKSAINCKKDNGGKEKEKEKEKEKAEAIRERKSFTSSTGPLENSFAVKDFPVFACSLSSSTAKKEDSSPDWIFRYYVVKKELTQSKNNEVFEFDFLNKKMQLVLKKNNITKLMPIQRVVIPFLCRSLEDSLSSFSCDVVVHAATGEGKTLCYVLPIMKRLYESYLSGLRCIVILPTRELATQVFGVFKSFLKEKDKNNKNVSTSFSRIHISSITNEVLDFRIKPSLLGLSKVNILITTPAKLFYFHQHVRLLGIVNYDLIQWIVIDEADRLLNQNYQQWISLLESISKDRHLYVQNKIESMGKRNASFTFPSSSFHFRKLLFSATMTKNPQKLFNLQLNKAIFFIPSITSTSSTPSKLKQFYLNCTNSYRPIFLIYLLIKLLKLLKKSKEDSTQNVKRKIKIKRIIIFCNSKESTHRLTRLLQIFFCTEFFRKFMGHNNEGNTFPSKVQPKHRIQFFEFSSNLTNTKRTALLNRYSSNKISNVKNNEISFSKIHKEEKNQNIENDYRVLISSDVCSRGIDMKNVYFVINYHLPCNYKSYIHRCGRTARAGKKGNSYVLVSEEEFEFFSDNFLNKKKKESYENLGNENNEEIKECKPKEATISYLKLIFKELLDKLEICLLTELKGKLSAEKDITEKDITEKDITEN